MYQAAPSPIPRLKRRGPIEAAAPVYTATLFTAFHG